MRTMKRAIPVLMIVGALAVPGAAVAGKKVVHKLSGPVEGDSNAKVSIEVVVRNGTPKKVKNLEYKDLDAHCNVDGTTIVPAGELSGHAGKNLVGGLEYDNSLFQWYSFPDNGAREVDARGRVKQRGKKVVGEIDVYSSQPCAASTKNKFTATK